MSQIMPCNEKMYAIFRREDKSLGLTRVLGFLFDEDDGKLIPLLFDCQAGISVAPEDDIVHYLIQDSEVNKN